MFAVSNIFRSSCVAAPRVVAAMAPRAVLISGLRNLVTDRPARPNSGYVKFLKASNLMKNATSLIAARAVVKSLSSQWSAMPAEEKKKYMEESQADREKYRELVKAWQLSLTPEDKEALAEEKVLKLKMKTQRERRRIVREYKAMDTARPKTPLNAYMMFSLETMKRLMTEQPSLRVSQLGSMVGSMYRNLSPTELEKYNKMAAADKARYAKEMENYVAPPMPELPKFVSSKPVSVKPKPAAKKMVKKEVKKEVKKAAKKIVKKDAKKMAAKKTVKATSSRKTKTKA